MKNLLKVSLVFVLFATLMVSCDKEIETSPVNINSFPEATIVGYIYAPLDLTEFGDEPAPVGTKVIITMAYSDLGLTGGGSLIDTVQLDSNGSFTYKVPADANGVTVTAKVVDFVYDQVQEFDNQYTTIKKVFSSTSTLSFSVKSSDYQVKKLTLNTTTAIVDPVEWYTLTGVISANIDDSNTGTEVVPSGTSITFNTTGWSQTVTIGTGGSYSILVPSGSGVTIYGDYDFQVSGKLFDGTTVTWRFKGSTSFGTNISDDMEVDRTISNTHRTEVD